jgi:drug/metabolite transporter (DMT)-like permease
MNAGARWNWASWLVWTALPVLALAYQVAAVHTVRALGPARFDWSTLGTFVRLPWAQFMVASDAASFAVWIGILSRFKLSAAFPMSAISYVLVVGLSWLQEGRSVSVLQIIGSIAILGGILLIACRPETRSDAR